MLCFKYVNILKIKHKQIIYMYENENTKRNWYYLKFKAYIYRKQNMSIQKYVNCDTNWNYDVNQVYNS